MARMAPLAKEKISKEIARHTDRPEVADQVSTAIIESVKKATGKDDPIAAVAAAQENPAFRRATAQSYRFWRASRCKMAKRYSYGIIEFPACAAMAVDSTTTDSAAGK